MDRQTTVIAFIGDGENTIDACRFLTYSLSAKILVADMSSNKELYTNIMGKTDCKYISYNGVFYTDDGDYAINNKDLFDIVLIYSDRIMADKLCFADIIIYCYGQKRKSYTNICNLIKESKKVTFIKEPSNIILYRGNFWDDSPTAISHMVGVNTRVYTVPFNIKNLDAMLKADYGYFEMSSLSEPMERFIECFQALYGINSNNCKLSIM